MSPVPYKKRPLLERNCLVCHTPIKGTPRRKYCTTNCRSKAYRKQRAWRAQPK